MLIEQLRQPLAGSLESYEVCVGRIRNANQSYRSLSRHNGDAEEILELKFASIYWRKRLLEGLLTDSPGWALRDPQLLRGTLEGLNVFIPSELRQKAKSVLDPDSFDYVMARQGLMTTSNSRYRAMAGPPKHLNIVANRSSRWTFERWSKDESFSHYEYREDGVVFRGLHLRPGDVLLANVNRDGNGIYTALTVPKRFSSHSAFVAILKRGSRRFPAAIETYDKGVRAVPLSVFLSARFCAYVEVYRHRELSPDRSDMINKAASEYIREVLGYNFDTEDPDRSYMSCTAVGRFLHESAGLRGATTKSRFAHPRTQANARKLEFEYFDMLAPVDYLLDESFECVGWVDNHQFYDLLARELVEDAVRHGFENGELDPHGFPFAARLNLWGIRHIRRRTGLGKLVGRLHGFDHKSLPNGPDKLLAVITIVEHQIGQTIKRAKPWVERRLQVHPPPAAFSLAQFCAQPEVRKFVDDNLRLKWLRNGTEESQ